MSYPHDYHQDDSLGGKDHELTLSTAAIFGIFFGLVILCGIFFGFGYSFGSHRSAYNMPSGSASSSTPANFGAFKPAAGQPIGTKPAAITAGATVTPRQTTSADTAQPPTEDAPAPATAVPVVRSAPTPAATHPGTPAAPPAAPVAAEAFHVQVAAININHPEDATLMMNALKAKGYAISAHPGPDNFIHLLIGPFNTRAAAESMRQRLLTDGYTAYIK